MGFKKNQPRRDRKGLGLKGERTNQPIVEATGPIVCALELGTCRWFWGLCRRGRPPCPETLAFRSKRGDVPRHLPLLYMLIGGLGVLVCWFVCCWDGVLSPWGPSASFGWSPPTGERVVGWALRATLGRLLVTQSGCPSDGRTHQCYWWPVLLVSGPVRLGLW